MKLKDWSKKQGISYLTAYRWFKAGKLPVKAYQSETGTIIVEESAFPSSSFISNDGNADNKEGFMFNSNKDITVEILKKMSSLSKEEFAYYILSNFELKRKEDDNKKIKPLAPLDHINGYLEDNVSHKATLKSVSVLEISPEEIENLNIDTEELEKIDGLVDGALYLTLDESKKIKQKQKEQEDMKSGFIKFGEK